MEENNGKLSNILRDYISQRRKINPKLSESQIARSIGVSGATFYRILNYNSYPSVQNLLKLCKSIPKIQTLITEEMLEVTRESKTGKYVGGELENLLFQKNLFITYALVLSSHAITEDELFHCLGQEGEEALRILIKKKYIKKSSGGQYRATQVDKGIILSFELLKQHLKFLAENYKPSNVANNYIYYKIESLNEKALRELYDIQRETHKKVQELMEKPENKGDIPVFSAGFCDIFLIRSSKQQKKEEEE